MQNGTVKFFNHDKGFGFVEPDDGSKDVFVHVTSCNNAGCPRLNEGDRVIFDTKDGRKGPEVDGIKLI